MTLLELRDCLAKATGPDKKLDVAFFKMVGFTPAQEEHCRRWCRMDLTREQYIDAWAPQFTGSIDAAVTLRPETVISERHFWSEYGFWTIDYEIDIRDESGVEISARANTLPLAFCRARIEYEIAKAGKP